MGNLYSVLKQLCDERGISGYKMCKDCGIQPSIMTDLKMGRRSSVKAETASRIASYFGVSVAYLLGEESEPNEQKEKPIAFDGDEQTKLMTIAEREDPDLRFIRLARQRMPDAEKKRMMQLLKAGMEKYFSDAYVDDDTDE